MNEKYRLLILSQDIDLVLKYHANKYSFPDNISVDVYDLSEPIIASVFDYDISVISIDYPKYRNNSYYESLSKIARDFDLAMAHGRTVICIANSSSFKTEKTRNNLDIVTAYQWFENHIELQDNVGVNIVPSGTGQNTAISDYINSVPIYRQIINTDNIPENKRLAVIQDTKIAVAMETKIAEGTLVLLPPLSYEKESLQNTINLLINVCSYYYSRSSRQIPIGDIPEWLDDYRTPQAKILNEEITNLLEEKRKYDEIEYVLYGTGAPLENSVARLFRDIGFEVFPQPKGANIDQLAEYKEHSTKYAFEITGSKDIIKKNSNKVSQAWQYISENVGTPNEENRLIIIANSQCHLEIKNRNVDGFSDDAAKLLGRNGVLMMTTVQLYQAWRSIIEGKLSPHDFAQLLTSSSGLFSSIG